MQDLAFFSPFVCFLSSPHLLWLFAKEAVLFYCNTPKMFTGDRNFDQILPEFPYPGDVFLGWKKKNRLSLFLAESFNKEVDSTLRTGRGIHLHILLFAKKANELVFQNLETIHLIKSFG